MRIIPFLTACLAALILFVLIFQRDWITGFLPDRTDETTQAETIADGTGEPTTETGPSAISVVALKSMAQDLESAVVVRGQTEAARQVNLLAETSGSVISTPLRRGSFVEEGQTMCILDPGTREASLAEAEARLAEARARVPEAQARVAEAEARLEEALINDRAASKLSEGGFASDTRVASATASTKSARAGVEAATSGLQSTLAGIESAAAAVAAAEKEIERLTIHASFSGLLETDTAELGSLLQPGALCATVIQLDPVKLVGFVPETDVDRVQLGAPAAARLINGSDVTGAVSFVSRSADPTTRTFRVEVEIPNPDLKIRDGQTVDILVQAEGTRAHLVPGSALTLNNAGDLGLRIVDADQTARFTPVRLIRDTVDGVWVDGLGETADVIVVGQEFVTDGVAVDVTYREGN